MSPHSTHYLDSHELSPCYLLVGGGEDISHFKGYFFIFSNQRLIIGIFWFSSFISTYTTSSSKSKDLSAHPHQCIMVGMLDSSTSVYNG